MGATSAVERREQSEQLTRRIDQEGGGHWPHAFEVDPDGTICALENSAYRSRVLGELFRSLLVGRSVLVLDEFTGIYPALLQRAGAAFVSASAGTDARHALIRDTTEFLQTPTTIIDSRPLAFYDGEPYVDTTYRESHEFALLLGQIWRLFTASEQSFDAIVEACAFLVTDGLIFDWTNAEWAKPPPPPSYTRDEFYAAVRRKFDYVTSYSDWLIVASGKLPAPRDEA